jgi:hypothetical protein
MKTSSVILISILLLYSTSCKQKQGVEFIQIKTISFRFSDILQKTAFEYYQISGDKLIVLHKKNLLSFSLNNGELLEKRSFENLDSISINSFLYHNADSTFLISNTPKLRVFIVDSHNEIISDINKINTHDLINECTIFNFKETPIVYKKNKLFINAYINWLGEDLSRDSIRFERIPPILTLDLRSQELLPITDVIYPKSYKSPFYSIYSRIFKSYIINDKEIIFTAPFLDSLFIYSGNRLETISLETKLFSTQDEFSLSKFRANPEYLNEYFMKNPYIYKVFETQKNNLILIVLEPTELLDDEKEFRDASEKKWGLYYYDMKNRINTRINLNYDSLSYTDCFTSDNLFYIRNYNSGKYNVYEYDDL